MRFHVTSLFLLGIVSVTTHCARKDAAAPASGAAEQQAAADTWSLAVQTEANLPPCNQAGDGRLAYIKSTMKFMVCSAGNWSSIDMTAVTGKPAPGSNGTNGSDGKNALIKVVAEPMGSHCSSGGKKVLSGIDANSDGILSDAEVNGTSFICNGNDGADGLKVASTWKYDYSGNLGQEAADQLLGEVPSYFRIWLTNVELQMFSNGGAFVTVSGVQIAATYNSETSYSEHWSHSFFLAPSTQNQVVFRKFDIVGNALFQFQVQLSETPIFKSVLTYEGSPLTTIKTFNLTKQ